LKRCQKSPVPSPSSDAEQADAVRAFGQRTLIVAGVGSGNGLSHLLDDAGFSSQNIMLPTFTRKATETMRERAAEVSGRDLSEPRCGRFHSVGARLLRDHARMSFSVVCEEGGRR
jgi:DNA helicase II / ATP-dependent DNA helicase PcrA